MYTVGKERVTNLKLLAFHYKECKLLILFARLLLLVLKLEKLFFSESKRSDECIKIF